MTRLPELDPEKLYMALDRERRRKKISWRKLRIEAGLPATSGSNTLTRLGQGRVPSTFNVVLLLLWVGQTDVRSFLKDQRDV